MIRLNRSTNTTPKVVASLLSWSTAMPLLFLALLTALGARTPFSNGSMPPAFPGAEGYGMYTTGGRGGDVYEVTSLADDGPGSLRDAINRPNRTIVFRISGTIELKSTLILNEPNITIAGQTAPGGGICLKNYALRVNTNNIIIRYLRVRPGDGGDDPQVDGISMGPRGGSQLIFDHCSVSWAIDENFSLYGLPRTTVQWCIVSEALNNSKHPKGGHGMGGILNGYDMSIHHNLFASNNDRNPKFDIADWWPGKNTDFRNNVIYNWGTRATWGGNGGRTLINVINNYYRAGPDSRFRGAFLTLAGGATGSWYVDGNIVEGFTQATENNWTGVSNTNGDNRLNAIRLTKPVSSAPVSTESAESALAAILAHGGASLPVRDSVDVRTIETVRTGTGKMVNSPADIGGWPILLSTVAPRDFDHDGMPDIWENANGLDPNNAADRNERVSTGYTMLEVWLNSLVNTHCSFILDRRPSEAYYPTPGDKASTADTAPTLRWKAGFGTSVERLYFGVRPDLEASDLRIEQGAECKFANKQEVSTSRFRTGVLSPGTTYYWRVDSINEAGLTRGQVWSFSPNLPVRWNGARRLEAESMTLEDCTLEKNATASNESVVSVVSGTGIMHFQFSGPSGNYLLVLCHLDEGDGEGEISIHVNGAEVDSWKATENTDTLVRRLTHNVRICEGDIIKITAQRHQDELARIDWLEAVPQDDRGRLDEN